MKITRLRLVRAGGAYLAADAIQDGSSFNFREGGVTVAITEEEYRRVTANPRLYYFSTALKLHLRVAASLP